MLASLQVHQQKQGNTPSRNKHVSDHDNQPDRPGHMDREVARAHSRDDETLAVKMGAHREAGTPYKAPARQTGRRGDGETGNRPEHAEMADQRGERDAVHDTTRHDSSMHDSALASEASRQPAMHEPPPEQTGPVEMDLTKIFCKVGTET